MNEEPKQPTIKKIDGYLHKIVPVFDKTGKVISHVAKPLMVKLRIKDIMQIIVGASILAVPVAFTEETWKLGEKLPLFNSLGFLVLSLLFISAFVYYNYYRKKLKDHYGEFIKRIIATYLVSFLIVAIILTLIQKTPWTADWVLAFKRIIIVTFPSSMSAAIADVVK